MVPFSGIPDKMNVGIAGRKTLGGGKPVTRGEGSVFKELSSLAALMRNAQEIGERIKLLGERLTEERFTGSSGGGLVHVVLDGTMEPRGVSIEPRLLAEESPELLEELVQGAIRDAVRKARARHAELLGELSGGLNLPMMDGLKDLLAPRPRDDNPAG